MNSYQLYKKMILISGGSKQRQQTNKQLNEQLKCKNETILAIKWNQQEPVIRTR